MTDKTYDEAGIGEEFTHTNGLRYIKLTNGNAALILNEDDLKDMKEDITYN